MQLAIHESGEGSRTAVLVHGLMSDSSAWHRVGAELVADGYRVLAVDLAGHGRSPRARRYSPQAWADDVVETVAARLADRPDLIVGHSLGALVASMVADRLRARSLVYVDPAFSFPRGVKGMLFKAGFLATPRPSRRMLRRFNPGWSAEDVELELAAVAGWDRRTLLGFARSGAIAAPARVLAPSLVILAERSLLIRDRVAAHLRQLGMTVEVVPGTGHTVFRDDHAGFMAVLRRWAARAAAPAAIG